jgi:N-acetylmuramoyl-L-alanine amidase
VFNSGAVARSLAWLVIATMVMLGVLPATAQEAEGLPSVIAVRVSSTPERARLILDLTGRTEFATVSLDGPDRIAVDVKAISLQFDAAPPVAGKDGIVSAYTVEIAQEGRARATMMLAQPAVVQQAYLLDAIGQQPARLVVDLVLTSADEFANRVADDYAAALAKDPTLAAVTPPPLRLSQDITASTPPATPPAPQASRPLIVIDPGHGGIDNGASAPNGVHEKDIVLAFALDLQQALIATGRYDVALTREDDTYLTLNERVALARQNKADLFISVHADTFQDSTIRGASIYPRDENATDILDKVLADNENKSDIVAGFAAPDAAPAVVDILVDLMRRQMRKQSYMAAGAITRALQPSVDLRRFPVRQADFFVLQAPDVPSILIELGFLSNPQDVANLQKNAWRDRVVEALTRGIDGYFTEIAGDTQTASP